MNSYLFPLIFFTCVFSQASFATHAYRSENCQSTSYNLNYLGNYPYGGDYEVFKVGHENDDDKVRALPLYQNEDSDIVFDTSNEVITSEQPTVHDCWFDHDEWTSTKDVSIIKITEEASAKLGLKLGDVIQFTCEETTDFPNGNECDEQGTASSARR